MTEKILVTGAAGFIGSTIANYLEDAGYTAICLDSLIRGHEPFVRGKVFYRGDYADLGLLDKIFAAHPEIRYVIHCAALISVPESVQIPFDYYSNNVSKSISFFHYLASRKNISLIFSSSASIYTASGQVHEDSSIGGASPYARSKVMMEYVLEDYCATYPLKALSLRYFNPIGCDIHQRSGPYACNPSHLLGALLRSYRLKQAFELTGVDWDTRDGSGIRDYIHIHDLALAHVLAVQKFPALLAGCSGREVINLGTGTGVTVKEFVAAFEEVVQSQLEVREVAARPGDVAGSWASNDKAKERLGWSVQKTLAEGIRAALEWERIFRQ